MTDLVARLLAAIEEAEQVARAAMSDPTDPESGVWAVECHHDAEDLDTPSHEDLCCVVDGVDIRIYDEGGHDGYQASHIARHDPRTVLRHCAADREQVSRYQSLTKIVNRLNDRAAEGIATDLEMRNRAVQGIRLSESKMQLACLARGYGITEEDTRD